MRFCEYKYMLGKPRQGFHSARIPVVDTALYDFLGTVLFAYVSYRLYDEINFSTYLGLWLLAGAFFHYLFCVYE